ncbi:Rieske (2Fe-2S) protein [Pseudofrankia inefficax]|uniref:Cytochrome bc1 complex Rieske iron-sulfur subunit n=1 Tax=Pseudofrankia inefficax (strain DSM 45817 / CECT 9037 / DDB 130130 / EuI1c) TaxID=298654 RepID=E3IW45_PSEI1|nr:Rieske (2Fe-2S) protein [Pseudofrankia inefficax]ADP84973.1 Rieske (2Fe-2S) iron-sulfur domain protein [Pseudofrankia inefficax]
MTLDATTQAEPTESPTPYPGLTRRVTVPLFALAAGAGGFLVAACGSSSGSDTTNAATGAPASTDSDHGADETPSGAAPTSASADDAKELTSLSKVPVGGGLVLADKKIVVTRDSGGTVHAFSAICTHMGCTVGSVSNGTINCPCHGSKFDATTGKNVAGPAPRPLSPVNVTVKGDDIYQA